MILACSTVYEGKDMYILQRVVYLFSDQDVKQCTKEKKVKEIWRGRRSYSKQEILLYSKNEMNVIKTRVYKNLGIGKKTQKWWTFGKEQYAPIQISHQCRLWLQKGENSRCWLHECGKESIKTSSATYSNLRKVNAVWLEAENQTMYGSIISSWILGREL